MGVPTSHVDLVPTLLGLVGARSEDLLDLVSAHYGEAHPLPGRDLSSVVHDPSTQTAAATAIYFMTEDQISQGPHSTNPITGQPFTPVAGPANIESVITLLPTEPTAVPELWKLDHYYSAPGGADPQRRSMFHVTDDWLRRGPIRHPATRPTSVGVQRAGHPTLSGDGPPAATEHGRRTVGS